MQFVLLLGVAESCRRNVEARTDFLMNQPHYRLFILGAGFSKPAGLPLAGELLDLVRNEVKSYFQWTGKWDGALEREIQEWRRLYPGKPIDLERVLAYSHRKHYLRLLGSDEYFAHGSRTIDAARRAIQRILIERTPTDTPSLYRRFARHLSPNDLVLTFNYDTLLEQSLDAVGKPYTLSPEWWLSRELSESGFEYVDLLKLHGSVDWYDRKYHDDTVRCLLENGHDVPDRDPIFGPNPSVQPEPLSKGETTVYGSNILPRVFRVPDHAQQSITVGDNGVLVPMLLRAIFGHLWPRGVPRGKHRLRAMQRLRAAMLGWNYAGIPDRGGLRRVIGTVGEWIALPDDYPLDDEVIFQVYLPPGATRGALIHRETMDYLGVSSGLMYRAMLTLAHQWWRATHTKGKGNDGVTRGTIWPYATRQVRLKDEAGNPIIRKGRTVPGDPNGEREPNPMIKYLPTYTDERILRLCYSPAQIDGAKRTRHLHTYQARAWAAVNEMEKVGLMEMGYHGVGLKLCPPLGWGVNFQMPESVKVLGKHRKSV